jgi:hypothetical protein
MKKLIIYTLAMVIIALGATSCGKRTPPEQVEYFEEADIDDGPTCGCETTSGEDSPPWHLYYSHTHII